MRPGDVLQDAGGQPVAKAWDALDAGERAVLQAAEVNARLGCWGLVAAGLAGLLAGALVYWGALKILLLESYEWALASCTTAMLPVGFWAVGFPVGLWGLVVLRRRKVRKTFRDMEELARLEGAEAPPRQYRLLGSLATSCLVLLAAGAAIGLAYRAGQKAVSDAALARRSPEPAGADTGASSTVAEAPGATSTPAAVPLPAETPAEGLKTLTNSLGMKFVLVPAGKFLMGSPPEEIAHAFKQGLGSWAEEIVRSEGPEHEVELTQPFYMAVHKVTVGQFRQFVEATKYRTEAERNGGALRYLAGTPAANALGPWYMDPAGSWLNPGSRTPTGSIRRNSHRTAARWRPRVSTATSACGT